MTSLEALRKLILDDFTPINDLVYRKGLNIQVAEPMYLGVSPQDCYNIIEKDLEVLEILKSHITDKIIQFGNDYATCDEIQLVIKIRGMKDFIDKDSGKKYHCISNMRDDFEKTMEWLENVNK